MGNELQIVVDRPGLEIKARDIRGAWVCTQCRGSGRKYVSDYRSSSWPSSGWHMFHEEPCLSCDGAGWGRDVAPSAGAEGK